MTVRYAFPLLLLCFAAPVFADDSFDRGAAPIFEQHCLRCHNDAVRKGGLSLQTRQTALAGGETGEVIAASDPDSSYLLDLVTAEGGKAAMPKGAAPLRPAEVSALRRWIEAGAAWPEGRRLSAPRWWSLRPLAKTAPAPLAPELRAWAENPIDAYIAAGRRSAGLPHAAAAPRGVLVRRLHLDLLGLPPEPRQIDEFLQDDRPAAWQRLVDRLLASPGYGERWARHWLDVVRFSESNGYEEDAPREHAWPYRDYVIDSFNKDKPYDLFVREQLAGDALSPVSSEGVIATSFLVAGPWDHAAAVSASAAERGRAREVQMEEMLAAVSQTFLALTANCARCHDHKFDPVPQADYYRLKAVFAGVDQANGTDVSPQIVLPPDQRQAYERRRSELAAELAGSETRARQLQEARAALLDERHPPPLNRAVAVWQFAVPADGGLAPDLIGGQSGLRRQGTARFLQLNGEPIRALNSDHRVLDTGLGAAAKNAAEGAGYAILPDLAGGELRPRTKTSMTLFARVRFTGEFHGVDDIFRIGSAASEQRDACGLDLVADSETSSAARVRFTTLGAGRKNESHLTLPRPLERNTWYDLTGVFETRSLAAAPAAAGQLKLYLYDPNTGKPLAEPVSRQVDYDTLENAERQNLLLFVSPYFRNGVQPGAQMDLAAVWHEALPERRIAALSAVELPAGEVVAESAAKRRRQIEQLDQQLAEAEERVHQRRRQLEQLRGAAPKAFIGVRRKPQPTHLLLRGEIGMPGEQVQPAGLSAIESPPPQLRLESDDEAERRVRFAQWVTDPRHPLTARVIVNRLWHYHFGRGLVDTPSDFGVNGGRPSHPQLLDWLAGELIRHDWSLKHIQRLIVTSATYRMSSQGSPLGGAVTQAADPQTMDVDNRLLWRFPFRRLEAETVRDSMLAVSGQLNRRLHGPSFRPFRTTRFNTYFYNLFDDGRPEFNRRTIYRMNVNTGRDPLLDALDCPAPSVMSPARRETTTPLQALALMNDAFVLRQAEEFARQLEKSSAARRERIVEAWLRTLGRPPERAEARRAERLVESADLTTLCWVLLNSDEFLHVR